MSDEATLRVLKADVATLRQRLANQRKRLDDLAAETRELVAATAGFGDPGMGGIVQASRATTGRVNDAKRALLDLERRMQALARQGRSR